MKSSNPSSVSKNVFPPLRSFSRVVAASVNENILAWEHLSKAGFINGTPVQIMVTGRLYDEATMLRVALAYERATEHWRRRPPVG